MTSLRRSTQWNRGQTGCRARRTNPVLTLTQRSSPLLHRIHRIMETRRTRLNPGVPRTHQMLTPRPTHPNLGQSRAYHKVETHPIRSSRETYQVRVTIYMLLRYPETFLCIV